jgi:hypothetical protein
MSYQLFELVSRDPHELGVFSLIFLLQGHCRELDGDGDRDERFEAHVSFDF